MTHTITISAEEFAARRVPDTRTFQYAIHWAERPQPDDEGAPAEHYTFCDSSIETVSQMERLSAEGHDLLGGVGWNVMSRRFDVFTEFQPQVPEMPSRAQVTSDVLSTDAVWS